MRWNIINACKLHKYLHNLLLWEVLSTEEAPNLDMRLKILVGEWVLLDSNYLLKDISPVNATFIESQALTKLFAPLNSFSRRRKSFDKKAFDSMLNMLSIISLNLHLARMSSSAWARRPVLQFHLIRYEEFRVLLSTNQRALAQQLTLLLQSFGICGLLRFLWTKLRWLLLC